MRTDRWFTRLAMTGIAACFLSIQSFATDDLKKAYLDGIDDTIKLFSKKKDLADKKIVINGYSVSMDISNLPVSEIVKYEILAEKLGYSPVLINGNTLMFGVFDRKADAISAKRKVEAYNVKGILKVESHNGDSAIATPIMKKFIPSVAILVVEKEGGRKRCVPKKEVVVANSFGGDCQIVNKIMTEKAFIKKYGGDLRRIAKSSYLSAKKVKKERLKKVAKNRATAPKIDISNMDFYELSKKIYSYGVIKGRTLHLFGKTYKEGDRINKKYRLSKVLGNGVVILTDNGNKIRKAKVKRK